MIKQIFELQNRWRTTPKFFQQFKPRAILPTIVQNLENQKILGLIGSRQVGKSSLLYLLIDHLLHASVPTERIFYFNLDDLKLHELFANLPDFIHFIGGTDIPRTYVFLDEVQRLPTPGLFLKEVYDLQLPLKIIYSGSSQLEVKSKLKEYLVGRARQFEIHRLAFTEYLEFTAPMTRTQALTDMLLYGGYPGVAKESHAEEKMLCLNDVYQSYVQKDLVEFLKIEQLDAFNKLLILLANQIGALLNLDSLANQLRITRQLVEKYLLMLESTFIITRIYPFHGNYSKEIIKTPKIYFLDTGLRNYILNNFNPLLARNDVGALFENFYLLELLKTDHYGQKKISFWRTTNQTEIDFVISSGNVAEAVEVKWDKVTPPKSFQTLAKYYPKIIPRVVTKQAFLEGVGYSGPMALSPNGK